MNAPLAQIEAHRFRTYMATIVSSVELLQHFGVDQSPAEREELIMEIGVAAQRMREMLDAAALARRPSSLNQTAAANEPCHG